MSSAYRLADVVLPRNELTLYSIFPFAAVTLCALTCGRCGYVMLWNGQLVLFPLTNSIDVTTASLLAYPCSPASVWRPWSITVRLKFNLFLCIGWPPVTIHQRARCARCLLGHKRCMSACSPFLVSRDPSFHFVLLCHAAPPHGALSSIGEQTLLALLL